MRLNKEEREIYEAQMKWLRIEASAIKKAEMKRHESGFEEGMEKGMEKGVEKIARKLLRAGEALESVAKITELSVEELGHLEQNE